LNHYEIIYIFNPDEKELGKSLFDKIIETTKSIKGQIHRSEEIGSRRLAYPIKDYYRGEYFLINLECNSSELASITELFKFNENILRTSVLKKKQAETIKSALMEQTKDSSYEKDFKEEGLVKKVSKEAKEVLSKAEEVVEDAIEEVKEAAEKVEEVVEEVVEEAKEKAKGVFAKVKNVFKSEKKK
jgi:small subunit ribosomal protein S6